MCVSFIWIILKLCSYVEKEKKLAFRSLQVFILQVCRNLFSYSIVLFYLATKDKSDLINRQLIDFFYLDSISKSLKSIRIKMVIILEQFNAIRKLVVD